MIWLLLLLLTPCVGLAQTAPSLLPGEGGGRILRTESYQGRSLSGYINGGAELFHEYGFVALSVQEAAMEGAGEITVEVFRMSSPRAALGIYSVSRHGCEAGDPALIYACEGAFQMQGTARENYIRIQSGTDAPAARKARRELFTILALRLGQEDVPLSSFFRNSRDVILMNGPLGVQNGMADMEEVLNGVEGYAVQAVWPDPSGAGYDLVAEITFGSDDSATAFAGQPGSGDGVSELPDHKGWWAFRSSGNVVRILKGSVDREHAAEFLMHGPSGQ
jgi:hypothetical protein